MAPELLDGKTYSGKCDVFSMGVLFYKTLFGKLPWIGKDF